MQQEDVIKILRSLIRLQTKMNDSQRSIQVRALAAAAQLRVTLSRHTAEVKLLALGGTGVFCH